jgi:hypothetical protein
MLIAQLIIDGKCHGLHNFLVQLRDMETHLPLAGVSVGDIGPKLGFNSMVGFALPFALSSFLTFSAHRPYSHRTMATLDLTDCASPERIWQ